MEHEITERGSLHDSAGFLREPGWSRRPLLAYDRSAVKAPAWRIKEWDYYCILGPERGIALTIADNGYMGFLSASVLDFAERGHVTESAMTAFPLGSLKLPPGSEEGVCEASAGDVRLRFEAVGGERRLRASWPSFGSRSAPRPPRSSSCGVGLECDLVLREIPDGDSISIATPFAGHPKAFYYNRKLNCMSAEGSFKLGDLETKLEPLSASGVLDWGRGVWTYSNVWYWASASGRIEGSSGPRPFGFNLGYGFGDTSAASENIIFLEGRAHKLGRVSFEIDRSDYTRPWRARDEEGRLDLVLEPVFDRYSKTDLFVLASIQHQVFGTWKGRVRLDDGKSLAIEGLRGFAEEVLNRW